jgi:hypothetical protein
MGWLEDIATSNLNPFHALQQSVDNAQNQVKSSMDAQQEQMQRQRNYDSQYNKFIDQYKQGTGNNAQEYQNNIGNFGSAYASNVTQGANQQAQMASRNSGMSPAQAALLGANTAGSAYSGAYGQGVNAYQNYLNSLSGTAAQAANVGSGAGMNAVGQSNSSNAALTGQQAANDTLYNVAGSAMSNTSPLMGGLSSQLDSIFGQKKAG